MEKSKILNKIFEITCIPINIVLIILGDAFIWGAIVILTLFLIKRHASKFVWSSLIVITIITLVGTFSRPLIKSETNQIYNYLSDTYGKDTFKIKKASLSVNGSNKFCGGTWISFCLGFKMFNWSNLKATIIDENNVQFTLKATLVNFKKFENYKDEYKDSLKVDSVQNYMNNKLIPILNQYFITDVKYYSKIIIINIKKESINRKEEEQLWTTVMQELQYDSSIDPHITIEYLDNQNNPIEYYYFWLKEWDSNY